jgi:hypothetical protein
MRRKGDRNKRTIARDYLVNYWINRTGGTLIEKGLALTPADENEVFNFFKLLASKFRVDPQIIRPGIIYRIARIRREVSQNWQEAAEAELRGQARRPPTIAGQSTEAAVPVPPVGQKAAMSSTATICGENAISQSNKRGRGRPAQYDDHGLRPMGVSAQIDKGLVSEIDALARKQDRSRSRVISMLLGEAVKYRKGA